MNTKRIPDRAGFVNTVSACRWCAKPKPWPDKYRLTFCSNECVEQHKIRTQPDHAAKRVLERDHGICCTCGLDTIRLHTEVTERFRASVATEVKRPIPCRDWGSRGQPCEHVGCLGSAVDYEIRYKFHAYSSALRRADFVEWCEQNQIPPHLRTGKRRLWEMDHVTPVVEGGADCGLENLRTLCWSCHRAETAALAARRSEKRKASLCR